MDSFKSDVHREASRLMNQDSDGNDETPPAKPKPAELVSQRPPEKCATAVSETEAALLRAPTRTLGDESPEPESVDAAAGVPCAGNSQSEPLPSAEKAVTVDSPEPAPLSTEVSQENAKRVAMEPQDTFQATESEHEEQAELPVSKKPAMSITMSKNLPRKRPACHSDSEAPSDAQKRPSALRKPAADPSVSPAAKSGPEDPAQDSGLTAPMKKPAASKAKRLQFDTNDWVWEDVEPGPDGLPRRVGTNGDWKAGSEPDEQAMNETCCLF